MKTLKLSANQKEVLLTLLAFSAVSTGLLVIRIIASGTLRLTFLQWNLFLAWLPVVLAFVLCLRVTSKKDITWPNLLLFALWVFFLPNSFYIMTDLIHLQSSGEVSLLYDTALITSYVLNGLLLGFMSIHLVEQVLKKFFSVKEVGIIVQIVLLLSAFAIYLGRYLRWNTWDVIVNPAGIIYDVSDRIINPGSYQHTFVVTGVFFVLLSSLYLVIERLHKAGNSSR